MNNYCTVDDVKNRFSTDDLIQLTDDSGIGEINFQVVEREVMLANSLINGYLGKAFILPLSVIPPLINTIAIDLSVYNIYVRRLRMDLPESIRAIYKNCIDMLKDIQKGNISLGLESKAENSSSVTRKASYSVQSRNRIFNQSFLDRM